MAAYLLIFLDSSDADAFTMTALLVFFNSRYLIVFFFVSVNKQINDKERIAAAMENPNLRNLVENCIADEE